MSEHYTHNSNMDEQIQQMLQTITNAKQQVELTKKQSNQRWLTTGSFRDGNYSTINIQTSSLEEIIQLTRYLLINQNAEAQVAQILGCEVNKSINGFSYTDILSDCKTRLAKLRLVTETQELNELETRVNSLVSPVLRRELELKALLLNPLFAKDIPTPSTSPSLLNE